MWCGKQKVNGVWGFDCFGRWVVFSGGKWTQVDDVVMQPFNFADAQFDLFLIACCQVNKWLDFSGAGQTMIL